MCKNVLIVDDDAGFVWQIMNNIKNRDCSIATANSLRTAENILDSSNFDVVVANVNVPGGNSLELKKHTAPNTKFLFMSGLSAVRNHFVENHINEICWYKNDMTAILDRTLLNA